MHVRTGTSHLFPGSLFWFIGGGSRTACLTRFCNEHVFCKSVKIGVKWCHQKGSVPCAGMSIRVQSWHLERSWLGNLLSLCFSPPLSPQN